MKITRFEDLEVWKISIDIILDIYRLTNNKIFVKDFDLRNQVRRASISISSNIVEGFERANNNEFIRYLKIAKGSVGEARNQLYIAFRLSYLSAEEFNQIESKMLMLSNKIGKFLVYLSKEAK